MGCINTYPKITIHSMESFKKETRKQLDQIKDKEDPIDKILNYLEDKNDDISRSYSGQSEIPIEAKVENSEFIFL